MRFALRWSSVWLLTTALIVGMFAPGCARRVPADALHAAWVIVDTEFDRRQSNLTAADRAAAASGGFFRLYPDGSVSALSTGKYRTGRWSWESSTSLLRIDHDGGREEYTVKIDGYTSARITPVATSITFVTEPDRLNYGDVDPYSPALNQWRIPAPEPMTDAAMDRRLLGMLRFLTAHLQSAVARDVEFLNLSSHPTPFIFAANGIALQHPDQLSREWVALFASRDEAINAAMRLVPHFRQVRVPQVSNRFERNALIFSQLADSVERQVGESIADAH